MAMNESSPRGLGEKLQSLPRFWLYFVLFVISSVPLFVPFKVPNTPAPASIDLYAKLMTMPEGSTVLLGSDWTNSTRGESMGSFEALVKICRDRDLKLAIYSTGDPQAPRVARDTIERMNGAWRAKGLKTYDRWKDWISLGYFPGAEATLLAIATDVKRAFGNKTEINPETKVPTSVFESPVFQKVSKLADCPLAITATASKTSDLTIERFAGKTPIAFLVTGVMGPETNVYYASGQIVGLAAGVKGVYDMETLMRTGINTETGVRSEKVNGQIPPLKDTEVAGKGTAYYPTLHFDLFLLIGFIAIGNIGMFLSKKNGGAA